MAKWYYDVMGQEVGPLTGKELLQKVRGGEVSADTRVRKDDSQWVLARDVSGLLESAGVKGPINVCPYCGEPINAAPTRCLNCHRHVETTMERAADSPVAKVDSLRDQLSDGEARPTDNSSRPPLLGRFGRRKRS